MSQVHVAGMAWYREENYQRLLGLFEDSQKLHRTYQEWLAAAQSHYKTLSNQKGLRVVRVNIDPDDFSKWCIANGRNLNASARMDYCNLIAYRIATSGGNTEHIH